MPLSSKIPLFSHFLFSLVAVFTIYFCFHRYVKREIRSLTNSDKEKILDAMSTLWKYTTDQGQEKYGDDFVSIEDFVAYHSLASNDIRLACHLAIA